MSDDGSAVEQQQGFHFRERSTLNTVLIIVTCSMTTIIANGSMQMMTIGLPIAGNDLNIPQARLQWLLTAFSLSAGCLLLLFGRIADLYGRKRVFAVGMTWLIVFTIGCGFAKNDIALDILRALSGVAPAATVPAALGILAHSFPPGQTRSFGFAAFGAGGPLGGAVGWCISAPLIQFTKPHWRTPFFLMAGLSAVVLVFGLFAIDNDPPLSRPEQDGDRSIDWLGALLVTSGLVLLTFALAQGEVAPKEWRTPYIIALLVLSPLLLIAFGVWEWYYEHHLHRAPLLRMGLWTRGGGTFAVVQIIAFFEMASFTAWIFWTTLYYQQLNGKTPILLMVRFLPMIITGILLNVIVGLFVAHIPLVILVALGACLTGVASILFAVIDESASYWAFNFPAAVLSVFGADFIFSGCSIFVARVAHGAEQSVAGGLFQTMVQLGSAVGIALSTIVHDAGVRRELRKNGIELPNTELGSAPRDAQVRGYRDGFWACFAFAAFAMVLGLAFLWNVGVVGDKTPKKPEASDVEVAEKAPPAAVDVPSSEHATIANVEVVETKTKPED